MNATIVIRVGRPAFTAPVSPEFCSLAIVERFPAVKQKLLIHQTGKRRLPVLCKFCRMEGAYRYFSHNLRLPLIFPCAFPPESTKITWATRLCLTDPWAGSGPCAVDHQVRWFSTYCPGFSDASVVSKARGPPGSGRSDTLCNCRSKVSAGSC
jgi:hypothetical protein